MSFITPSLDPPERSVGAEFGDFAGTFAPDVNTDGDHTGQGAEENEGHEPGRNLADAHGAIKSHRAVHLDGRVEKDFCDPGHHDEDENEKLFNPDIHRVGNSDNWECDNCSFRGDVHFMKQHICIKN